MVVQRYKKSLGRRARMYDPIEHLKIQIKSTIREYESLFTEKKPMPEHRCLDVVDLRVILDRPYNDINSCINAVKQRISDIKTGWLFIKTGRSRLRSGIMPIIEAYENPVTQLLAAQVAGISQSFAEVVNQLNDVRARTAPIPIPAPQAREGLEVAGNSVGMLPFSFSAESGGSMRYGSGL